MIVKEIKTNNYLTKSNLPSSDYVINPYVGCTHACKYCYASFMKRFTNHPEAWGEFIDVKMCDKPINLKTIKGKRVFLSSVTDCYNELEEKYEITRNILKQLVNAECHLSISTKSSLILRDLDLLRQINDLEVCLSVNTLDEKFKDDMDNGSSIKDRLMTLKSLHENGIKTILFVSPIFPYITNIFELVEATKDYIDEYWFENLNLRGNYKSVILNYIQEKYPEYYPLYINIYLKNDLSYWQQLSDQIAFYCEEQGVNYINYFYHDTLVQEKKNKQ